MQNPIYFDSHMHTPLCKHAVGEPFEYAESGKKAGLKGIIMTCHSPMPKGFSSDVRMSIDEFPYYVQSVEQTRKKYEGNFEVLLGIESDWFPGMEDWLIELHEKADFHYIIGSVHPFIKEYKTLFNNGNSLEFQKGYFNHLADTAESRLFDCISHPDVVKNMFPLEWDFSKLKDTVDDCLNRIKDCEIAMELNTSGLNKSFPEMNPGTEMLAMMKEHNIPVVISSDSHTPKRVGADFDKGLRCLKEVGYDKVSYFKERKRIDLNIQDVAKSMGLDI